MSYPTLTGYGQYYDSNQNQNQSARTAYGSNRQSASGSYGQQYQQDDRNSQYESTGYDWQNQNQPTYATDTRQQYSNHPWREANGQHGQYDYRREASNFATQAAAGNTAQNKYPRTSQPGQSLQGLNSPANASGPDNQRQGSSNSQQTGKASSKYSTIPASVTHRVPSPMQGLQQQHYSSSQANAYGGHDGASTSTASPQLAISAAQALAGAVSRRYQQSGTGSNQRTTSPTVSNAPAVNSIITQSHARGPSTQSQGSYPQQQQPVHQTTDSTEIHRQLPASSQSRIQHNRQSSQNERLMASQSVGISSLMSTTQMKEPTQTSTAVTNDSMPTYIDPSQVFNPYHKEHERRRKEAFEAEARRKEQEAKAQEEQSRNETDTLKTSTTAPKSRQKIKTATPPPAKSTSPVEDEMALEMKMMMEKMMEFRSKDPTLFQKLWEDMRKGSGAGASADPIPSSSTPVASTSPQISQQTAPALAARPVAPAPGQTKPPKVRTTDPTAASQMPYGQANGYKVVVEYNEEGLPEIGRFPAERRICGPHTQRKATPALEMPAAASGSFPTPGLSSTAKQSLPEKPSAGGAEWPLDKRDSLASAAIESLKAIPENEKIRVTPADIHEMLAQNPSYIQLCDMLDKKGLKFHRGQFARQLLISVPDLATPQKEAASPSPAHTQVPPTVQRHPPLQPPPPPLQPPPPPLQQSQQVPYSLPPRPHAPFHPSAPGPMPYPTPPRSQPAGFLPGPSHPGLYPYHQSSGPFHPTRVVKPEHSQFPDLRLPKKKSMIPAKSEPPPGSKEAMARKRDLSELLVDLTGLSDNDDYVLSSNHTRLESASPEPDPFARYQQNSVNDHAGARMKVNVEEGAPLRFNTYPRHQPPPQRPPSPPQRPKAILARPLNKHEALRKSYYDPKTVAKDILIAAGRHPTERPLNAHWAGLLGVHIDLDSDLSTFDWDSIDPGGPPAPKVEYVDIPAGPPRFKLGERPGEPRLPDSAKRSAKEAAATVPSLAPLPSQLRHFKGTRRYASDQLKSHGDLKPSKLRQSHVLDESSPARALTPQKRKLSVGSSPNTGEGSRRSSSRQARVMMESEQATGPKLGAFYPSGKRRGRPPGAKNRHPTLTTMKKAARASRPFVEIPMKASPSGTSVFRCRWRGCHAELHNLDTLRRHLTRVHPPSEEEIVDHGYVCWWKKCRFLVQDGDEISASQNFETEEDWQQHIEKDHLHKLAMKLGDGPNTLPIGKQSSSSSSTSPLDVSRFLYNPSTHSRPSVNIPIPASAVTPSHADPQTLHHNKSTYLSDETGKMVTPSLTLAKNPDLPRDTLILTKPHSSDNRESDIAAQKGFLRAHSKSGEKIGVKMNAEEMLRAMERRKMVIGPGVERGGCTLVNEARREGFVGNKGIRRVVPGDY